MVRPNCPLARRVSHSWSLLLPSLGTSSLFAFADVPQIWWILARPLCSFFRTSR